MFMESATLPSGVIHIFGASGSGTTTLGAALANRLGLLHLDADDFYWRKTEPPFQVKVPPSERVAAIRARLEGVDRAVLSGSLCSWSEGLAEMFAVAILVRLDPVVRMQRLRDRERERNGVRIEPGGDLHQDHLDFMAWAEKYDEGRAPLRTLHLHRQWMSSLRCPTVEVSSLEPVPRVVQQVERELAQLGLNL
jgi:adenylate kinase family enzyme